MGPYQVLPLPARMDMGIIALKRYSTFLKAPGLKPESQIFLCHIQETRCSEAQKCCQRYSPAPTDWIELDKFSVDKLQLFRYEALTENQTYE